MLTSNWLHTCRTVHSKSGVLESATLYQAHKGLQTQQAQTNTTEQASEVVNMHSHIALCPGSDFLVDTPLLEQHVIMLCYLRKNLQQKHTLAADVASGGSRRPDT